MNCLLLNHISEDVVSTMGIDEYQVMDSGLEKGIAHV